MVEDCDNYSVHGLLSSVVSGNDLTSSEAYWVASEMMEGRVSAIQIGALLVALRMKVESVSEITGFVRAMRDRVDRVPVSHESVVDTCGMGGDALGTFNISTVAAMVAAGAGCKIAKHGNRSVSSKCGSSEVLESLGIDAELPPDEAGRCIDAVGIAFMSAPRYHQATRHAVLPRR